MRRIYGIFRAEVWICKPLMLVNEFLQRNPSEFCLKTPAHFTQEA